MATDAAILLRTLQDYYVTLDLHVQKLQQEWTGLDNTYRAFQQEYEGDAAREFHANWLRTKYGFEQYIEGTQPIGKVLNERISALFDAERTGTLS